MRLILRFLVGGTIVSLSAVLGDLLRPKGFAGLFSAAPSVALGTLTLTVSSNGSRCAAIEARSMIAGEVALVAYAMACTYWLGVRRTRCAPTAVLMISLWGPVAAVLYVWALAR